MPFDRKEYMKKYNIQYFEKNKEKRKEYLEKNKEKIKQYRKKYRQTEKGKKSRRITDWKRMGVIFFDYDLLYEIYINTTHCDNCNCQLTEDKTNTHTTRCLDHDHNIVDYDNVRNILCHSCNAKRRY